MKWNKKQIHTQYVYSPSRSSNKKFIILVKINKTTEFVANPNQNS